jgi:hypothetical protein
MGGGFFGGKYLVLTEGWFVYDDVGMGVLLKGETLKFG